MDRRREYRQVLDFEEFPLNAEFISSIFRQVLKGHIQNISSSGLCILLLNHNEIKIKANTTGILHIRKGNITIDLPAKLVWTDDKKHFIRYAGLEVPNQLLNKKLHLLLNL